MSNDIHKYKCSELICNNRNVFAGIMENMKEGIDANSVALDSNGSALKENAIYMDSASAKINEFKESLKEVWINTIDSSAIKGVVEGGTAILNIFNKIHKIKLM